MHALFSSRLRFSRALLFTGLILFSFASARAVTIPTVPVGDAGNANDPSWATLLVFVGGVNYDYRIGTTEVTNAQYADFLNAKAASDPLGLYNVNMGSNALGGITQSGLSGGLSYSTKTNMADKPVNYVSWYDSIRFANWLNNGQGTGDTETGAYTLLGGTPTPSNGNSITREPGATWFLPTQNEWYKAAYYQPSSQGGDVDNYWLYPTASNSEPTLAFANNVGDISNPGTNVANYFYFAKWNNPIVNVTTVGSAGPLSKSFYGTSDQGGNVWEWNEALVNGSFRGVLGGGFDSVVSTLRSKRLGLGDDPTSEYNDMGFRVATVPEPTSVALAAIGIVSLVTLGWQRRKSVA
jgi:formylglycine-generating enzyme required for sulfatase activity